MYVFQNMFLALQLKNSGFIELNFSDVIYKYGTERLRRKFIKEIGNVIGKRTRDN